MESTDPIPTEETPVKNETLSHYRTPKNKYGETIYIPVVDVRDGLAERMLGESMLKAARSSKYIVYNRYHQSAKKISKI